MSDLIPDSALDDAPAAASPSSDLIPDAVFAAPVATARARAPVKPALMPDGSPYTGQPWQDAILNAFHPGGTDTALGAAVGTLGGGIAGGVKGGYKGIFDLATKGVDAAADTATGELNKAAYKPQGDAATLTNEAINSKANPLNWPDLLGQKLGDVSADAGASPLLSTGLRVLPDAAASLFGMRRGAGAAESAEPAAVDQAHPLAADAQAEVERLGQIKQTGLNSGLDLPEGGTAARHAQAAVNNQPVANAMARTELQLPTNAPLTPQLLAKARQQYASPAYEAIKQQPTIELGPDYHAAIDQLNEIPAEFSPKLKPPEGDSMTGEEAVDLSKKLRYRANQYDRQASIGGSPEASDLADLHRGAADAIEDAVQSHLEGAGQGQLAQDWDDARVYTAKTYSVQGALDGAGNVKATNLKTQLLKNRPLSGNLEVLANLAAQYPQAFKLTQQSAPEAGLARRAAAAVIPHVTTLAGGAAGSMLGPFGSGAGALGGRVIGERIADRILP